MIVLHNKATGEREK